MARHHIGPGGARALAGSPHLTQLAELRLDKNPLGDEGVAALSASPYLRGLVALRLAETGLTAAGVRALAAVDWPRLEVLNLERQWLGPLSAQALAASPLLRRLRHLDLTFCSLGEEGLRALAASPHLHPGLRIGTFGNGVEGGEWRQFTDWDGSVQSEGYEDVSARPPELAKKGIRFPPGVDIF